jgi:undecaprenyl-diphosphatase
MNSIILIQILYELLPVSSSGHCLIYQKLFPMTQPLSFEENIFAHIPTIIIISIIFFPVFKSWYFYYQNKKKLLDIVSFFSIAMIGSFGFVIKKLLLQFNYFINCNIPLWYGFLLTTCMLFISKDILENNNFKEHLNFKDIIFIGFFQIISLIPGISRMMSTIIASSLRGISKRYTMCIVIATEIFLILGGIGILFLKSIFFKNNIFALQVSYIDIYMILATGIISYFLFHITLYLYKKNKLFKIGFYEMIITCIALLIETSHIDSISNLKTFLNLQTYNFF